MDKAAYFEQMRQKRRNDILDAAKKMILTQGIDAFNIQQLARELDISTVTLYKYFKNSEDIMLALQEQIIETHSPVPDISRIDINNCDSDPLTIFLDFHRALYRNILRQRENVTLLALFDVYLRNKSSYTENRPLFSFYFPQVSDFLTGLLEHAKEKGQIAPAVQIPKIFSFISCLNAAFIRQIGLMGDENFEQQKDFIQWQTDQLVDLIRLYLKMPD